MLGEVLNWTSDKFPLFPCLTTPRKKSSDFQNLLYCIVRFRTFPLGNITLAICFNDIASVIKNIKLERKPQAITLFWMTNYRKCSLLSTTHLQQWHLPWLWKVQVKIPVELTTSAIVCSFGITQPSRMENNNPQSSFWLIFCYDLYKHFEGRRISKKNPETFEEFQLLANLKDSSLAIETNLGEGKC